MPASIWALARSSELALADYVSDIVYDTTNTISEKWLVSVQYRLLKNGWLALFSPTLFLRDHL